MKSFQQVLAAPYFTSLVTVVLLLVLFGGGSVAYPGFLAPQVGLNLLIANVVVFFLQMSGGFPLVDWFALWPEGNFAPWQLVTYSLRKW